MARPTRKTTRTQETSIGEWLRPRPNQWRKAAYLFLAGACMGLSTSTLSPVYGLIPATLYHTQLYVVGLVAIVIVNFLPVSYLASLDSWLPVWASWIPTVQWALFKTSDWLGETAGPLLTEIITVYPMLLLSVAASVEDDQSPSGQKRSYFGMLQFAAPLLVWMGEKMTTTLIPRLSRLLSNVSSSLLQLLLAASYACLSPSKLLLLTIPALLHSVCFNEHMPFPSTNARLNGTLESQFGFKVLARSESITGYLSVIENPKREFRALRCDHSLLGGEWLPTEREPPNQRVRDPIFAVFVLLEAVRLVELVDAPLDDATSWDVAPPKQALVIGLGVGTSVAALVAHGVNTTVVEIDPRVHDYAMKYFALPSNHTSVIEDAVTFTQRAIRAGLHYDYIIHDVFTGGAEPVDLFTVEFVRSLFSLLRPDGVIAINYAGDLLLPSAQLIIRTVYSVFLSCRTFREFEAPQDSNRDHDFANLVMFCVKSRTPFRFRQRVEADYLGSPARREYFPPRFEVDPVDLGLQSTDTSLLTNKNKHLAEKWQKRSAREHWRIMRGQIPYGVWENW
ncbi:MAG: hypothetical protein M1823_000385 [Watsoniomyces obsoletus]|nr:MAG: hypothetical protein M1823_000385 [Watsoniomyces obsoletus]